MNAKPGSQLTKSAFAYQEIRRQILSGELVQGRTIPQGQLADDMGVSTTPLREALRRLAAEGLVTIDAHRDARVTTLTAEEALSLFEVRQRLDPLAAGLAANRRTDREIHEIEVALNRLEPLSTTSDLEALEVHRAFHRAVYRASHNALLTSLLEGLWDKADRYRQVGLESRDSDADSARVSREHAAIAAAVIKGEPERAESAMLRHVRMSLGRAAVDALAAGHMPEEGAAAARRKQVVS